MRRVNTIAYIGLAYLMSFAASSADVGVMTVYVSPEVPCHDGTDDKCRRVLDIVGVSHPDSVRRFEVGFSKRTQFSLGDFYLYTLVPTPSICYQPLDVSPRPPANTCFELTRRELLLHNQRARITGPFTASLFMPLHPETTANGTSHPAYFWRGNIIERASPPTPTKCTVKSVPIDFGSINLREINGKTAYNAIRFRCNAETRVTVSFTNLGVGNSVEVKPNLFANLSMYGKPGNVPTTVTVPKDQTTQTLIEATLTTTGTVDGGPFTAYGVYRLTFP